MVCAFLVVSALLPAFIMAKKNNSVNTKKLYCLIMSVVLILVAGLRDISVGYDTLNYQYFFHSAPSMDRTIQQFISYSEKDPGYALFTTLARYLLADDYQLFLVLTAILFTLPLTVYLYINSKDPMTSIIIYIVLFFGVYSISANRQALAIGICLVGYEFIKRRNTAIFLLLAAVASTIHLSALVFVPFYILSTVKITYARAMMYSVVIVALFILRIEFFASLINLAGSSYAHYEIYEGAGAYNFAIILLLLTVVALWRMPRVLEQTRYGHHYYNALFLTWILLPLTFVNPAALRIPHYYAVFLMLLVPEIIESFNSRERPLVMYISLTTLIFFGVNQYWIQSYRFFFQ